MEEIKVQVIKPTKTLLDSSRDTSEKLKVCAYCRVSTKDEEQKESFRNQIKYYTDLIKSHKEWKNAGIYADEGISGTRDDKRPQFMQIIQDAMEGKINIILVKSLSRFSRNTVALLNYVRALREKKVSIRFEEEHIDTLTEAGELMITILSSANQNEVTNTSNHVTRGLKMKMSRRELVGFQGCLGYDYDPRTKSISINEQEAKVVRYIYERYMAGVGTTVLARELKQHHYKTKAGSEDWCDSTILGIIKNEKYKGDLVQGKTFTLDPIFKKRLPNQGESEKYYVSNHHPAIVSDEVWKKANEILQSRSYVRKLTTQGSQITRLSKEYTFSSMLHCGFCHHVLCRRKWKSGPNYEVIIWQCMSYSKHGKNACPYAKGISEACIEGAFVDAYNHVIGDTKELVDGFIELSKKAIETNDHRKEQKENEEKRKANKEAQSRLAGLYVQGNISEEAYQKQFQGLIAEEKQLNKEQEELQYHQKGNQLSLDALQRFSASVHTMGKDKLKVFSPSVFDSCISKVIVGGYDGNSKPDPYRMTFVFKKGFRPILEKAKESYKYGSSPIKLLKDPQRSSGEKEVSRVMEFSHFYRHQLFLAKENGGREKRIEDFITIEVDVEEE